MDDHVSRIQMPYRFCSRRLLFMIGIIASFIFVFQTFSLPYKSDILPLLLDLNKEEILPGEAASLEIKSLGVLSVLSDAHNSTYSKELLKELKSADINDVNLRTAADFKDRQLGLLSKKEVILETVTDPREENVDLNSESSLVPEERQKLKNVEDQITWSIAHENVASAKVTKEASADFSSSSQKTIDLFSGSNIVYRDDVAAVIDASSSNNNGSLKEALTENSGNYIAMSSALSTSSSGNHAIFFNSTKYQLMGMHLTNKTLPPILNGSSFPSSDSKHPNVHIREKRPGRLPVSVSKMRELLLTYYSVNHHKRISARGKQLLTVKGLLQGAPVLKNDAELYGPIFLNISKFMKSYELMEQMLRIYVYKEGSKPIFHQPLLRGIYASEGWFMKLLQTDKHFVVRDHRKAHLFYMPFSSRLLQLSLYVHGSHSHSNLVHHLKNYVDLIAAKYPYWNRTGGADHFVAACHDWAPRITAQAMGTSIRALCNADLRGGFQLGKDVSLPEIYVRSARNPLRDLGGNSAENRSTLAFYAGNLHGRLRPVLLHHWENKDPDMKILGPMPPGVESKMIYIQHMKNSKYCICPRGYEVNSPRVVESIYYECVPVIISDNYVPPFIEVLNWEAFSIIIPEEDVPRLKDLLVSIPEEKYRLLQLGVRKVQQHFLWHSKPVKYDLFHMILHSVWYNRVHQV